MNEMLHIGFDTYVNLNKIKLISATDSEKLRRELKRRGIDKSSELLWDAANGKEIKSAVLLDDGMIIASAVNSETLFKRINGNFGNSSYK